MPKKDIQSGQCFFCPFVTDSSELPKHLLSHHKSRFKNHICSRCNSSSDQVLTDILLIECQLAEQFRCGKPFNVSNLTLKIPSNVINDESPVPSFISCPFLHCLYSSCRISKVVKHVMKHHAVSVNGAHFCQECFFEGDRNELVEHLKRDHYASVLLECCQCTYVTNIKSSFECHSMCKHPTYRNVYHCNMCNRTAKDLKKLIDHLSSDHSKTFYPFSCIFCPSSFQDELSLANHLEKNLCDLDSPVEYYNEVSNNQTMHYSSFNNELSLDSHPKGNPCDMGISVQHCTEVPDNQTTISIVSKKHKVQPNISKNQVKPNISKNPQTNFTCPFLLCSYVSLSEKTTRKHAQSIHNYSGIFMCSICSAFFNVKNELILHFKSIHNIVSLYSCDLCSYICGDGVSYEEHYEFKHPMSRLFRCKSCSHKFSTALKFFNHMLQEHDSKFYPFKCGKCPFSAQRENVLIEHSMKRHNVLCKLGEVPKQKILAKIDDVILLQIQNQIKNTQIIKQVKKSKLKLESKVENTLKPTLEDVCSSSQKSSVIETNNNDLDSQIFCPYIFCSYKCKLKSKMFEHLLFIHSVYMSGLSVCSICFIEKTLKSELLFHYLEFHKICRTFSCNYCSFVHPDQAIFNLHDELKHSLCCGQCNHLAVSTEALVAHKIKIHGAIELFRCVRCTFSSSDKKDLYEHSIFHCIKNQKHKKCDRNSYVIQS